GQRLAAMSHRTSPFRRASPGAEQPSSGPQGSLHMKSRAHAWLRFLVASMGMLAIAPAFAELEEIVVTAQRREEDQQKVPISIATATAGTLESIGVRGTDELGMIAPGLTIQRQIGSVLPYIRGIGNPNTSGGQESSVAPYVGGFFIRV